jgi:hypothetical protein
MGYLCRIHCVGSHPKVSGRHLGHIVLCQRYRLQQNIYIQDGKPLHSAKVDLSGGFIALEGHKVLLLETFQVSCPIGERKKRDLQSSRKISSNECGHRYCLVCCESIRVSPSSSSMYVLIRSCVYPSLCQTKRRSTTNGR